MLSRQISHGLPSGFNTDCSRPANPRRRPGEDRPHADNRPNISFVRAVL